jgi:hypothetical protein
MPSRQSRIERVAQVALKVAEETFPNYAHPKSPKKYRLPQMAACVLMKTWLRQDYRGFVDFLVASPPLRAALGLKDVPHYSTLAYVFKNRFSDEAMNKMLSTMLRRAGIKSSAAAVDSTGFQINPASAYFVGRRGKLDRAWAKLGLAVLLPSLLIAHAHANWFPASDRTDFVNVVEPAAERVSLTDVYADAGYDAEWIHQWCRDERGIRSWIRPSRVKRDGTANGRWRNVMATAMTHDYGRRWGIETVFSVIKRRWGATTVGRSRAAQKRETLLKAVVYGIDR